MTSRKTEELQEIPPVRVHWWKAGSDSSQMQLLDPTRVIWVRFSRMSKVQDGSVVIWSNYNGTIYVCGGVWSFWIFEWKDSNFMVISNYICKYMQIAYYVCKYAKSVFSAYWVVEMTFLHLLEMLEYALKTLFSIFSYIMSYLHIFAYIITN